ASPRIVAMLLFLLLASPAISAPLMISAPPGVTTIKAIDVEAEAVRLRLVVTLTRAVSYRIAQPRPVRLVIDIERANFDFSHPVDLDAQGGWVVDWSYGYLMLGF